MLVNISVEIMHKDNTVFFQYSLLNRKFKRTEFILKKNTNINVVIVILMPPC